MQIRNIETEYEHFHKGGTGTLCNQGRHFDMSQQEKHWCNRWHQYVIQVSRFPLAQLISTLCNCKQTSEALCFLLLQIKIRLKSGWKTPQSKRAYNKMITLNTAHPGDLSMCFNGNPPSNKAKQCLGDLVTGITSLCHHMKHHRLFPHWQK